MNLQNGLMSEKSDQLAQGRIIPHEMLNFLIVSLVNLSWSGSISLERILIYLSTFIQTLCLKVADIF